LKRDILFLILQFLLVAVYVADPFYLNFDIPSWIKYCALVFLATGIVIILFGVLNLNQALDHMSPSIKNTGVFFRGIYRYIGHPIYAGMLVVMIAVAWFMGSWFKMGVTVILGVIFYFKSSLEEHKLIQEYVQYKDYKESTGCFFPKLRNIRSR